MTHPVPPPPDLTPLSADDRSSPNLTKALRESAAHALADVAMAPMDEIRHSPWLLRVAMLLLLAAAPLAGWAALRSSQPDWGAYLAAGLCTFVLVGNFMRWRRKWGWLRRALHLAAALAVLAVWTALLADRALGSAAPQPAGDGLGDLAATSPWHWWPVGCHAAAVALLVSHYLVATRRDRQWLASLRKG